MEKNYDFVLFILVLWVGIYFRKKEEKSIKVKVGILFYWVYYLFGNIVFIDVFCKVLIEKNLDFVLVFIFFFRDVEV